MVEVVIAGIGQVPSGEHWNISLRSLATRSILAALQDAGSIKPEAIYIGNMLGSIISHQANLGSVIADNSGLTGLEAYTVEAAEASGAGAFRLGYLAVASGDVSAALVVGVEKFSDASSQDSQAALAASADYEYESTHGVTPTTQAALIMQRYLQEFQPTRQAFGEFPLLAYQNAAKIPDARGRSLFRLEDYSRMEPVCDPLNIYDIAACQDGAAAILLTRRDLLPKNSPHPVIKIGGSAVVTDTLALHDRPSLLDFEAARLAVELACQQAGCTSRDMNLFEPWDGFSIYTVLCLEAAGYAQRGQGWKLAHTGRLSLSGALPILTLGGLRGCGNTLAASGVYQLIHATRQLRGAAGPNQVKNPHRALVLTLGGPASTAVAHVLETSGAS